MLKCLRNNQRGIVFVTVLIILTIAMVLAISTLSLNVSQVRSSEDEIRYIQAKALAEGGFARIYMDQFSDNPLDTLSYTEQIGNTTFTIDASVDRTANGPAGSDSYQATVDVTF
jgi:type II secretory pathway component PulK